MSEAGKPLAGIAFPFRVAGGVRRARDFEKVAQDVRHLLGTRLGERVMLRGYGGGVHHRLQSPNDATLRALVRHEVEESLRVYMPGVELVAPIRLFAAEEALTVSIEYRADPGDIVRRLELEVA